jgi:hypothetical protein
MTDLQLGLVVIGALVVAGVFFYNRLQERSVRREAEQAFGSRHADALLDDEQTRREPVLGPAVAPSSAVSAPAPAEVQAGAMPDERVDYVIQLELARPMAARALLEYWAPIERRFGKRVLLAVSAGQGWRRASPAEQPHCVGLRAGLQLVSRAGVTGEAELIEFRSEVETLAAKIEADIAAPEMREALEAAADLDRVCAEADIQVALHVVGVDVGDEALEALRNEEFQIARGRDGLTFSIDVPRAPDIGRAYEAMARSARQLASSAGGRLVDDHGKVLDDQALAAIRAQLEPARLLLAEQGIEPGSPLALRLFS